MTDTPITVLVLCTGNSARSILGEVLLRDLGQGRLRVGSAGSKPAGTPNPFALEELARRGHATDGLASKSWDVFAGPDQPPLDIVITVCDNAAGETCPIWPGAPVTVHWGLPDPAGLPTPEDSRAAFAQTYDALRARAEAMLALPLETMSAPERKAALTKAHEAA